MYTLGRRGGDGRERQAGGASSAGGVPRVHSPSPSPLRPRQAGATPHPLPCAARALRYATGKGAPIPAYGLQGYGPRALRPEIGGADRGERDSGRPPLRYGATTRSSEQGAHNSPARTAVALPPLGIYGRMCLSASFVVRPRLPALVDGRPSTSQGTRYGATAPGGDKLPRSVLLGFAFSLMPRRARVRSLSPPRYEPSRCASCARIASDCLRVLLALVRVSVPLVDRTAPLRSARLSTSSQTRAHPCAGMARVTLARGSPPCAAGYAGQRRGVKAASPRLRRLWP